MTLEQSLRGASLILWFTAIALVSPSVGILALMSSFAWYGVVINT